MTEFHTPVGVPTHLTLPELRLLQRYAHEAALVIEIGALYGYSTIGMILAGAAVVSIDPHYEGPTDDPDTWEPFAANLERHDCVMIVDRHDYRAWACTSPERFSQQVAWAYRCTSEWYDKTTVSERQLFDMAFIDGNHTWPGPDIDLRIVSGKLVAGGIIAVHDVTPAWPGVWRAVNELVESRRAVKLEQAGTMAVYRLRDQ